MITPTNGPPHGDGGPTGTELINEREPHPRNTRTNVLLLLLLALSVLTFTETRSFFERRSIRDSSIQAEARDIKRVCIAENDSRGTLRRVIRLAFTPVTGEQRVPPDQQARIDARRDELLAAIGDNLVC